MEHNDLQFKIDRMAEIKRQQETLKTEWAELEAYFLKQGGDDLADTKRKTVSYSAANGKVTATMSESVKVIYASYLERIFGNAFKDCVTVDTKHKLSAPAARMLGGLWSNNYTRMTIAEVIEQIPVDDITKKLLTKKLKGANYETDKKNLLAICGLDDDSAEHFAYFISEAAIWENFCRLMKVNQVEETADIETILDLINGAVVVEETPKISFELITG